MKDHEQTVANVRQMLLSYSHGDRTHGLESELEKTENKPIPLKNNGPIQQTTALQCPRLQLLGTGWVLVMGERNSDVVDKLLFGFMKLATMQTRSVQCQETPNAHTLPHTAKCAFVPRVLVLTC